MCCHGNYIYLIAHRSSIFRRLEFWSFSSDPNNRISSAIHINPLGSSRIYCRRIWKISIDTVESNCRRCHLYRPYGVPKVIDKLDSPSDSCCQSAHLRSTIDKRIARFNLGMMSSSISNRYHFLRIALFNSCGSMHTYIYVDRHPCSWNLRFV